MTETKGYFGQFGGSFVPEPIQNLLNQLEETFEQYKNDPEFIAEYKHYLKDYSGRETPLYFAESLTDHLGGAKIYLKREDLNHLGSHKLNNVLGQILLAKRMGKTRVIAETGAGQHGVATAAAAAKFGMACDVYMGAEDVERQRLNVFRMEMMGATVHAVETGTKTLKDAVDAAFGAWMADLDAFYVLGSAVGPHPYPTIVHEFQKVISEESKRQILEKEGRLPDYVIACVGGGSNAIGAFSEWSRSSWSWFGYRQARGYYDQRDCRSCRWYEDLRCLWRRWKSSAGLLDFCWFGLPRGWSRACFL